MPTMDVTEMPTILEPRHLAARLERDAEVKILDVRTPAEFESSHIPGSYNLPLDQLPEHREELRSRLAAPAVLVCRSGARARQAEQLLRQVDIPALHVLDGGLTAWEQAGLPVKRGTQRWGLERQVRGIAGGLVLAGLVGSAVAWPPLKWLSALVGGGLLFSALTDTCAMGNLLARLPYNRGASSDISATLARLTEEGKAA